MATVREPARRIAVDLIPPPEVVGLVLVGVVSYATVSGSMVLFNRKHLEVRGFLGSVLGAGREQSRARMRIGHGKYPQPH